MDLGWLARHLDAWIIRIPCEAFAAKACDLPPAIASEYARLKKTIEDELLREAHDVGVLPKVRRVSDK